MQIEPDIYLKKIHKWPINLIWFLKRQYKKGHLPKILCSLTKIKRYLEDIDFMN